jgi:hypothetical protein
MRRHLLGILAVLFLLGATVLLWVPGEHSSQLSGVGWRLGAFLAVWWLAWPDLDRLPGWLLFALPLALLVVLIWRKTVWLVVPLLIVLALVKPRLVRRR